ncbi:MAG: molybdenum cofactor biosynthesis protein MoaE [Candidatus Thermoplasmatota archaeon]|nr:molybdenum cofactor biosynthesis protein MoaE [Candidatus Thermoplasmatota archaeon]MCL6091274.1 molybdenum cofactor biosynthesis protein MoaE [Candidatus Thermoplasmatota archaeon]MDA8144339.1 molybdenum cofactor biosynthesis protein MoaE [Thermoplasmatales archaeon]
MMIRIQEEPLDLEELIQATRNTEAGAIVTFQGTVRKYSGSMEVTSLIYESYKEMALNVIQTIVDEAKDKFGVLEVNVLHRIGTVNIKEDSVAISVSSAHRKEAFKACEYIIDSIKEKVPIWKKDVKPGGEAKWRD